MIWRRLRIFIYNFEHIVNFEHLVLLFLLFTLSVWNVFEKPFSFRKAFLLSRAMAMFLDNTASNAIYLSVTYPHYFQCQNTIALQ